MGLNYNKLVKDYIGEMTYSENSGSPSITLPCEINSSGTISFVLCDNKGKTKCEKNTQVKKGKTELTFSLSALSNGNYNAWIKINDQTYLRSLNVQKKEAPKGLFKNLKKWI